MIIWDFIDAAFRVTGAWLSQYWPELAVLAIALMALGWLLSEIKHAPLDEPTPDVLSEAQKDALRAWVMRNKMPPAPEMVALAQEWLAHCREYSESEEKRGEA